MSSKTLLSVTGATIGILGQHKHCKLNNVQRGVVRTDVQLEPGVVSNRRQLQVMSERWPPKDPAAGRASRTTCRTTGSTTGACPPCPATWTSPSTRAVPGLRGSPLIADRASWAIPCEKRYRFNSASITSFHWAVAPNPPFPSFRYDQHWSFPSSWTMVISEGMMTLPGQLVWWSPRRAPHSGRRRPCRRTTRAAASATRR